MRGDGAGGVDVPVSGRQGRVARLRSIKDWEGAARPRAPARRVPSDGGAQPSWEAEAPAGAGERLRAERCAIMPPADGPDLEE